MKIKIHEPVLSYIGEPLKETRVKDGKATQEVVTILDIFSFALNNQTDPNEIRTAEDRHKAYQLSKKLFDAKDEVDLTLDDRSYLKDRIEKMTTFAPLVLGRMSELLEDKAK